ncbi:hypothetical protein GIB67_032248 [Kingdonia uniflora]|uniref:DNA-directed RNA polymerase n=1 Tax=Kingdonia uniflora TaxID=39325 RepID=A0A7J7MXC9_9MAGN|nr:hypothetical protein GIB67_032248 [Kingdonia uniflora]
MAAKVALSPGSQSQKVDSIFAKPLINQTLATRAKVFQFVQKDLALVSQSGAINLVMDLKVSPDSKVPSPAMDFQVRVELSILFPGNIRVYCRISTEAKFAIDSIGDDGSLVLIDPLNPHQDTRKVFHFNRVFSPTATQGYIRLYRQKRNNCGRNKGKKNKCVDDGKTVNLYNEIKANIITNGLKYSLATGNWGKANTASTRAGVSQVLNRLTYASTLSHLRRLNSPIGREGKLAKPRQLHNLQWGMMCPAETLEGQIGEEPHINGLRNCRIGSESNIGILRVEY